MAGIPHWGQLVVGPPGSGKSTYCRALHDVLNATGRRTVVVNLDPANDALPYPCAIDILDLVALPDVAGEFGLGPNGGLVYCLEYLERNVDWLEERLRAFPGAYFLFDCPGQAELVTHHTALQRVAQRLQKLDYRLVSVNLIDAHHTADAGKFIAATLLSLTTMIRLELPALHVLSKTDVAATAGDGAAFNLDFYADVVDVRRLADTIRGSQRGKHDESDADDGSAGGGEGGAEDAAPRRRVVDLVPAADEPPPGGHPRLPEGVRRAGEAHRSAFDARYRRLNAALAEIIEDHSLVAFVPMAVGDASSVQRVVAAVDRAGGFVALRVR